MNICFLLASFISCLVRVFASSKRKRASHHSTKLDGTKRIKVNELVEEVPVIVEQARHAIGQEADPLEILKRLVENGQYEGMTEICERMGKEGLMRYAQFDGTPSVSYVGNSLSNDANVMAHFLAFGRVEDFKDFVGDFLNYRYHGHFYNFYNFLYRAIQISLDRDRYDRAHQPPGTHPRTAHNEA